MKKYDFIFAGGGLSATVLLYLFLQSPLRECTFLMIEKQFPRNAPRGWSFWLNRSSPFDEIVTIKWKKFAVFLSDKNFVFPLVNYEISYLESKNYYAYIDTILSKYKNVDIIQDEVTSLEDSEDFVCVHTSSRKLQGKIVFDSAKYAELHTNESPNQVLRGLGGEVSTKGGVFDPDSLTFMDFRGSPPGDLLFFYSMPITQKKAFIDVAHVIDRNDPKLENMYENLLDKYIRKYLGINTYTISNKQYAEIPLRKEPVSRYNKKHIVQIGAKGGMVNPISSYGFVNIFKDSEWIVDSFVNTGTVGKFGIPSKLTQAIESAMLELMQNNPTAVKQMYMELFLGEKITGDKLLSFLNNELSALESIKLISQINPKPIAETFQKQIVQAIKKV